jgi:hypothetical protein
VARVLNNGAFGQTGIATTHALRRVVTTIPWPVDPSVAIVKRSLAVRDGWWQSQFATRQPVVLCLDINVSSIAQRDQAVECATYHLLVEQECTSEIHRLEHQHEERLARMLCENRAATLDATRVAAKL